MNLNSIIIKGKFFVTFDKNISVNITKTKNLIIEFLENEGYLYEGPINPFRNFLSMSFIHSSLYNKERISMLSKIKKYLGLISDKKSIP